MGIRRPWVINLLRTNYPPVHSAGQKKFLTRLCKGIHGAVCRSNRAESVTRIRLTQRRRFRPTGVMRGYERARGNLAFRAPPLLCAYINRVCATQTLARLAHEGREGRRQRWSCEGSNQNSRLVKHCPPHRIAVSHSLS